MPRLLGVARRHPRLGSRLAEGAEDVRRPPQRGDGAGPRRRGRDLSARLAEIVSDTRAAAPADVRSSRWTATHLALTRAWANDAELARLMDRAQPVSEDEHDAWFAALHGREDCRISPSSSGAVHVGNVWLWDDRRPPSQGGDSDRHRRARRARPWRGTRAPSIWCRATLRAARAAPRLCLRAGVESRAPGGHSRRRGSRSKGTLRDDRSRRRRVRRQLSAVAAGVRAVLYDYFHPDLSPSTQALVRSGYGVLMVLTLVQALPEARRFFLSERWGGYAKSTRGRRRPPESVRHPDRCWPSGWRRPSALTSAG